tara:strand:+ start:352 stop:1038 length:687 start_codon:yes stop_codon:yes gene_type:complete
MRVLELFSGTGSVGKVSQQLGYDVLSVDLFMKADIQCDIMNFDYKRYPKNHFDIIWASPPCCSFSHLQYSWIGRYKFINGKKTLFTEQLRLKGMEEADKLVLKTLEIIEYFNPPLWFIENPSSGDLKKRQYMKDINFYDIDYCKYSLWGYKKPTRIWTNKKDFKNLRCDTDCYNMIGNKHAILIGLPASSKGGKNPSLTNKYRIPPHLIHSLFNDNYKFNLKREFKLS